MLRLTFFAGFAGLHLAVLQFCYFFLLLINVTSTYVTYITVVVAWMGGTMAGLLWRGLRPQTSMVGGVLAYYLTYALVFSAPLSATTLPISAIGVAVTGLWAGQLFVELLPSFSRADRLFLHENNGFLLGIVGVFIGFTLLGTDFLLGAPALSLLVQVVFLVWLRLRPPEAAPREAARAEVEEPGAPVAVATLVGETARAQLRRFAILAVALNVLIPAGMLIDSALSGDDYWKAFHGEDNLLTWFSSVQLVTIGLVAWAVFLTTERAAESAGRTPTVRRWIWVIFALGFVFLALDERFELHEMLRDDAMRPAKLFVDIPWMRAGDIGLFVYLLVGCAFGLVLLTELRRHMPSLWLFLGAIAAAAVIVVIDALPKETVRAWPMPMFWNSVFEEMGEQLGQLLFLLSFLVFLSAQIREIGRPSEARTGESKG